MHAASSVFNIHRPKTNLLGSKTNHEKEVLLLLVSTIEVDEPLLILRAHALSVIKRAYKAHTLSMIERTGHGARL